VRITCDPAKREWTLRERAIDFRDAAHVFAGRTLDVEDRRQDYGEPRIQTIGYLAGCMVMVVWTPRGRYTRHVISMRKCNDREQARYRNRLEKA
jgi:uncharacterized DUF497 family protein